MKYLYKNDNIFLYTGGLKNSSYFNLCVLVYAGEMEVY